MTEIYLICPYCGAGSEIKDDYCRCCGSDYLLEMPDYLFEKVANSTKEEAWKIIDHQKSLKQTEILKQSKIISNR